MSQTISLDEAQLLSSIDLFKGLDRVALAQLAARLERLDVPAGQDVVSQGEPGDALYVIASGEVEVAVRAADAGESVVNRQGPGEYFGEMALLTDAPRSATVRAAVDTVVLRLGRKAFSDLLQKQPAMASTIIRMMSERLRRADSALVSTDGALHRTLDQLLASLPGERRAKLLEASLLDKPTVPRLRRIFGLDAHEVWEDLARAGAVVDEQPVPEMLAPLRRHLAAEVGQEQAAFLASGMAATLAGDRQWEAALELLAAHGPRAEFVQILARALRDVPAPDPDERARWVARLTDDEAAQDVELALARAEYHRENGNAAAAVALLEKVPGQGAPAGGDARLADLAAELSQQSQLTPVVERRGGLPMTPGRTAILLGAAAALVLAAAFTGQGPQIQFLLLLGAAIVLWVGRVAADSFVGLGLLVSWILLGVVKPAQALAGFGSSTWIFVVAVLALAAAVARSGLLFRVGLLLIRRMPRGLAGQSFTLALTGILLTPLLPMAQGRVSLVFPLTSALADALELEKHDRRAVVLGLSAWLGTTPMTFMFLNGAPFTLLAWGLLPPADQARFNWLFWAVAALPLAVVITAGYIGSLFLVFRPKQVSLPPRAKLDLELAVLGKAGRRELAMLVVLALTIAGWILAQPLGIDVGVVALLGVLAAVATGNLSVKSLKDLDWNFLLFYGAALSVGGVAVALGLDKAASSMLRGVLGFTQGMPFLFIVVVALVGIVVQLFISKGQAVLLLSLVLLPVAASFGLNPWIAAIVILATSSMWYYRAQTSSYALAFSLSDGRLFTDNQGRIACLIFTAAMFAGLAVSMPYWRALGLL